MEHGQEQGTWSGARNIVRSMEHSREHGTWSGARKIVVSMEHDQQLMLEQLILTQADERCTEIKENHLGCKLFSTSLGT